MCFWKNGFGFGAAAAGESETVVFFFRYFFFKGGKKIEMGNGIGAFFFFFETNPGGRADYVSYKIY